MTKTNYIVSVLCATYNHENYIGDAIEGFLMQKTTFPIEIIIHDDASTDETAEIIKNYTKKHPDIIFPIFQTENKYSKNISIYKNYVEPRIRGKYIAICEGDDYWKDPLKLQKQVGFLENNPEYGLVFTDADILYDKTGKIVESYDKTNRLKIPTGNVLEVLFYKNPYKTCTSLYRNENISHSSDLLLKHQSKMGDKALWLNIASNSKVGYIPYSSAVYRVQQQSASHFQDIYQAIRFRKDSYKISLLLASHTKYPIDKKKLKSNYRKSVITVCVTGGYYKHLQQFVCYPTLIAKLFIKEKIVRKLLLKKGEV